MPADEKPNPEGIARLLVKALQSLPEKERDQVLEYLVGRALEAGPDVLAAAGRRLIPTRPSPRAGWPAVVGVLEFQIARLLAEGRVPAEVAQRLRIPDEAVGVHMHVMASFPGLSEQESKVFRLFGLNLSRVEVAERMNLSEQEVGDLVEGVLDREARRAPLRLLAPQMEPFFPEPGRLSQTVGQQMVPVRLSEDQHLRLKTWCKDHGFSMAVVIRGLVERFLEDQARRAS